MTTGYAGAGIARREACVCGGDVEQRLGEKVEEAVRRHNAGERHQAWRRRNG